MRSGGAIAAIHWKPSWRVIPTRYPEIDLWKRVAVPEDEAAVQEIEQITNNRARQESGEINLLRAGDYFSKSCSKDVIATFSYRGIRSRFNTRLFGAYYASVSLETAVREKAHHTIQLLMDAKIPSTKTDMRAIKADIRASVQDIRGMQKSLRQIYHPSSYSASQPWASHLWAQGSQGVVYDSVRHPGGQCIAIFSPQTISHCHKDRILAFKWNGRDMIEIAELKEFLEFREP